jgi:glutathione synthase
MSHSLSFLVLTDHPGHSDQNSLYALVTTLARDPRCRYVDVASRGAEQNEEFFGGGGALVQGFRVKEELRYSQAGQRFTTRLQPLDSTTYDVIWLRLPHPVPDKFFTALSALPTGLIVNEPDGIRQTSTKEFLLRFPEWTPPARLVRTQEDVAAFVRLHPIVLKPLRDYGGRGIRRIDGPGAASGTDLREPYLAMKFLKNVSEGDKRILVVNGRILAASLRLPPPGEWLCNVARGGTSVMAEVTEREREMVAALAPELLGRGICFAGIDTLTDDDGRRVLSEINTLSIGGFPQAEAQTGRPIVQYTIDELFHYCYAKLPD